MSTILRRLATIAVPALIVAACTEIVYRDRLPFNAPPDGASFLGYFSEPDRQTSCGNCHVGQQQDWVQTAHATAWNTLQANPNAQPACEVCHTVNSRGNQPLAVVGYESVKSAGYHDVQCESCHGPGYTHAQNPTIVANRPLASINVDSAAAIKNSSCAACHQEAGPSRNHNYLREWQASRHGQLRVAQASSASCQPCHEGKGALAAWGINTEYKEKGSATLLPQNCVVCHDPHGSAKDAAGKPLEGQLRFPINTRDITQNLCTHCHGRVDRAIPNPTSTRGPHGTQGPVVFGDAGYFPPGSSYDTTIFFTSHGSNNPGGNQRLCAGCHVNPLSGVDSKGNSVSFTGHTFHPLPCLQEKVPSEIVDTTFTNGCAYDVPSRSWAACTKCHVGGDDAIKTIFTVNRTEFDGYARVLWINYTKCVPVPPETECVEVVDPFPLDSGYLAKIKAAFPGDLDYTGANKNLLTEAKGAVFNVQMLGEGYAGHPDGSKGVHNPFLYRALLQSSIATLAAKYPGTVPAPPVPVLNSIQASLQSGLLRLPPATEQAVRAAALARGR